MSPVSSEEFSADAEGTCVVTADGEVVGEVVRIEDGTAFVRPRTELVAGYGSRLTGCWDPSGLFPLDEAAVTTDGDGRIRIKPAESTDAGTLQQNTR